MIGMQRYGSIYLVEEYRTKLVAISDVLHGRVENT